MEIREIHSTRMKTSKDVLRPELLCIFRSTTGGFCSIKMFFAILSVLFSMVCMLVLVCTLVDTSAPKLYKTASKGPDRSVQYKYVVPAKLNQSYWLLSAITKRWTSLTDEVPTLKTILAKHGSITAYAVAITNCSNQYDEKCQLDAFVTAYLELSWVVWNERLHIYLQTGASAQRAKQFAKKEYEAVLTTLREVDDTRATRDAIVNHRKHKCK